MDLSNIIDLLCGVALFLFGMTLMGDGLKKVAGSKLELVLYRLTSSTWKGALLGTAVTAVIQSSSATSVMVVGFVNSGMMKFRQAIGIILGAILGTSITGWIICLSSLPGGSGWVNLLSTSTITGAVAVVGIYLRFFSKDQVKNHIGDILMGFAILMVGMSTMSGAVSPLRESEVFIRIFTTFSRPLLGILVGALFTCVIQSSSAAVGILQALAVTGAVDFATAFPIIMGISIGAAFPVLLSALGTNTNGKRTAVIYLIIEVIGAVIWSVVFYSLNAIIHFSFTSMTMTAVSVAAVNSILRFLTLLVLLPFIGLLEKLTCMIIPDNEKRDESRPEMERLEERFLNHPTLALEQCRHVINDMAHKAKENLFESIVLLTDYSDEGYQKVYDDEKVVDRYEDSLGTYLMKITSLELTGRQNEDISKFLHTLSDIERISDHSLNIAKAAKEIHEKSVVLSGSAGDELHVMESAVKEVLNITIDAFVQNDLALAARVEPLEEVIDDLCDELKLRHVDRLKKGTCVLNHGFVFNDLITNFERVADHCSNIAVAIIELESDSFETHEYLNSLKRSKEEFYANFFEEYKKQFALQND